MLRTSLEPRREFRREFWKIAAQDLPGEQEQEPSSSCESVDSGLWRLWRVKETPIQVRRLHVKYEIYSLCDCRLQLEELDRPQLRRHSRLVSSLAFLSWLWAAKMSEPTYGRR